MEEDLARFLRMIAGGGWAIRRERAPEDLPDLERPANPQVGRLWAAEEVARLMAGARPRRAEAVSLAVAARIVMAVSGAVVLETAEQYAAAGLEPMKAAEAQSVPDAASTLILTGGGFLLIALGRRWLAGRRLRRGGPVP
jgi:hypothetical protein